MIRFNKAKLENILLDFYNATSINICIVDSDFQVIAEISQGHSAYCQCIKQAGFGIDACIKSDKALYEKCSKSRQTEMHICHAGLLDIALPVIYHDRIIAYVIMGQMRIAEDFSSILSYVAHLNPDLERLKQLYERTPVYHEQKIRAIANIAVMLTRYILLENMLMPTSPLNVQKAEAFIDSNLDKELTIRHIAQGTNLSKSVLYKDFHTCFHCTVKEYINTKRVEKSTDLLLHTDMSMEEIANRVGFSSSSYFSKIFKSVHGISPLNYRKLYK